MCLAATESVNHGLMKSQTVFDDQDYELKGDVLWPVRQAGNCIVIMDNFLQARF